MTPVDKLVAKVRGHFAPPARINVAEWADLYREIPRGTSAEPGRWRNSRLPYLTEIMESFTDPTASEIILEIARQMGKTECIINAICFFADVDPCNILVKYPTQDSARKFSQKKLAPVIRETPRLKNKFQDPRSRDSGNTIFNKAFPGGSITMIGANSSSGTRAVSCRVVIQDEIDSDQPNSEGDPIEQADGRAENFHDAVKIKLSTPTRKPIDDGKGNKTGSRIQILYDDSDQRQWHCPCPKCGLWQPLHWRNVKWTWTQPDGEIISDPERAVYVCDGCAVELSDFDRVRMVMAGTWIAKNPHSMRRGYHLSGLYRIMGKKRAYKSYLHEFVARFLDAKHQGPEVMRVWVNTFLAECYEETIEMLDVNPVYNRRETYGPVLPKKVLVLTCQVDVQGDRLECMIKGWGLGHESWGIQFKRIMGNPFKREVWAALDEFISQQFDHPTLGKLSIPITLIDSGGQANDQGFADEVYRYVRTRQPNETGPGVYAIKGSSSSSAPLVSSRRPKTGICLKVIGTGNAKTTIHARLKLEQPGPRFMHYNLDGGFDEEYFAQLGAEAPKVVKKKGYTFTEWHKIRTRNEAFDLEVYSLAAIEILNPDLPSIAMRSKSADTEPEEKPAEVAKPKTYRLRKPPARTKFAPRFQPRFRR